MLLSDAGAGFECPISNQLRPRLRTRGGAAPATSATLSTSEKKPKNPSWCLKPRGNRTSPGSFRNPTIPIPAPSRGRFYGANFASAQIRRQILPGSRCSGCRRRRQDTRWHCVTGHGNLGSVPCPGLGGCARFPFQTKLMGLETLPV